MSDNLIQTIDSNIGVLESELRSDPRFRRLMLWRELRSTYDGELATSAALPSLPPPPAARAARKQRKAKAVAAKPVRKGVAPKKPAARSTRSAETAEETDAAVLDAVKAIQGRGELPLMHEIGSIVGCHKSRVATAIQRLIADKKLAPQGGKRDRTYVIGAGKPLRGGAARKAREDAKQPEFAPATAAPASSQHAEEPDQVEEVQAPARHAKPLPSDFDIDIFKRAHREVMMGLLSVGDKATANQVVAYADVPDDRISEVLGQLRTLGITYEHQGKWSLTDLGYSAALAVREDERG